MFNQTKSAFITRKINKSNPFFKILIQQDFEVNGLSFIRFKAVEVSNLPNANWIFFYSKNGIRFFFEQLAQLNLKVENIDCKWATIGQASTTYLEKLGIKVNFVGTGEPLSTSEAFLKVAKGERVLFPRAFNSKKSIQNILGDQIRQLDLVIYENHLVQNVEKRNEDFLVFTSPMNAQAYFNTFKLEGFQKAIAIGQTTAKALTQLGINDFTISTQPSEKSLAEAVLLIDNEQLIIDNEERR